MPRLSVIDPEQASGDVREVFDGPLKGKHLNIFKGMANSPAALHAYLGLAGALAKASLSAKEQEAIQLLVSQQNGCSYCLAAHTAIGMKAGLSQDQTVAVRQGVPTGDAKLDALVRFASNLYEKKGRVSDEDLAAVKGAGYDDGAVAEAVASYALAMYTNAFNIANDTEVDFPPPPSI